MQQHTPPFATVTFISGDDTPGNTFRVPIGHETTVRQLAKDAMQRLVLSRRSAGQRQVPSIMVTEVFVGGDGQRPKAEVFSQDLLTQVVLVQEEVIFMRLQSPSECKLSHQPALAAPPSSGAVPAAAPTRTGAVQDMAAAATCAPLERDVKEAAAGQTKPAAQAAASKPRTAAAPKLVEKSSVPNKAVIAAKPCSTPPVADRATRATKRARQDVSPEEDDTIKKLRAEEEARRLRWGPEASECFAPNYISSPNRLMSRRKPARGGRGKPNTAAVAPNPPPSAPDAAAAATGDAESFTREGWGPEAYKNFAANYVTSPDRLARLIRQQKRAQKSQRGQDTEAKPASTATTADHVKVPLAAAPKRTVSRQLAFPDTDDGQACRLTVGHGVTLIEVEDDREPTPPPPKGWGTEASKFFDTKTYCDDPSKARLTEEERSRPMQTRHSCRP